MFAGRCFRNHCTGLRVLRQTVGGGREFSGPSPRLLSAARPRYSLSPPPYLPSSPPSHSVRRMSDIGRGTDLLADSLAFGAKRKIILDSYMPTGFDVLGMLNHVEEFEDEDDEKITKSQMLHMNGSIIAFPHSCFLWKVEGPKDVTAESLSAVLLHKPAVEFLFIGTNKPIPPRELNKIKKVFKEREIVVEQLNLTNAMGTFNILNGEDRRVAVALVIDSDAA